MLMLQILGAIAAAALLGILHVFNLHCLRRFNYHFFTVHSFIITAIAVACIGGGTMWYDDAITSNGDTLNGMILIGIGVLAIIGLVVYNFRHTNFRYGFVGSLLQLLVFGTLAVISIGLLFFAFMLAFGAAGSTTQRRGSTSHHPVRR